jgi:outer membrane lipoprotein-sorting protein
MMKYFFIIFVLAACAYAQTLDEIVAKCLEVSGQDKLSKVQSLTIKVKIVQSGMEIPMVLYQKRPLKFRSEATFQGTTMLQVFDGTTGYMINPFMGSTTAMVMNAEQIERVKEQADIDNVLYNYKTKNYLLEQVGTDSVDGIQAQVLQLTKPNSEKSKLFIDPENYLVLKVLTKMTLQGVDKEIEMYPSNYKYVDGILFPFYIEQKIDGQSFMQMNFESFELNSNPPDSLFVVAK